jgi:S1-C subfamily serine protease
MKKSKKICAEFFAVILILCGGIFSCGTTEETSAQVQTNFTEDSAFRTEWNSVKKLSEKNLLKSLWRAKLLAENSEQNPEALSLLEEISAACVAEFDSALEEKKYFDALEIFISLESVESGEISSLKKNRAELEKLAYADVPGGAKPSVQNAPVAEMIKGTVTVYVDKGIKIQRGIGYADAVLGSGFFISGDGYIVTNHHVISDMVDKKYEGFSRLYIKLAEDPDTRIPAKVVGYDSTLDLALLKTEIDAPYVFALGSSSDLSVGDKVFAIGSPLGLEKTLTSGIISSADRQIFSAGPVFQVDAAINSGNSGGPLIDTQGKVQAIVFAGVPNFQGLNFAIPVEYLKNSLPFLFKGGEREHPWIGAYGKTKRLPGSGAKNEGVNVFYVLPGASADRSGIKENDVLISLGGEKISSVDDLQIAFMKQPSGVIVPAEILSEDGSVSKKILYLEKRPSSPGYEIYRRDVITSAFYPMVGMSLVRVSPSNKKKFSVQKIIKGSAADETGFSENDPVELLGVDFSKKTQKRIPGCKPLVRVSAGFVLLFLIVRNLK